MRMLRLALSLSLFPAPLRAETLTMSTTYPAPSGIYQQMVVTGQTSLARDAGLVGIGTANPLTLLHLKPRTPGNANFSMEGNGPNAIRWDLGSVASNGRWEIHDLTNDPTGTLGLVPFRIIPPAVADTLDVVGGNVGVGTAAPGAKLDVAGSLKFGGGTGTSLALSGPVSFTSASGTSLYLTHSLQFAQSSVGGLLYGWAPGNFGGREVVLTVANGLGNNADEIWIGPNGGAYYGNVQLVGNALYFSAPGGIYGGYSYLTASDSRLKSDIKPIPDALEKISRLSGVSYRWKDPALAPGTHLGLIAQDVEKVFPELVGTNPKDGMKAVDYTQLIGALVESLKELKARNEELARKIESLERRLPSP